MPFSLRRTEDTGRALTSRHESMRDLVIRGAVTTGKKRFPQHPRAGERCDGKGLVLNERKAVDVTSKRLIKRMSTK